VLVKKGLTPEEAAKEALEFSNNSQIVALELELTTAQALQINNLWQTEALQEGVPFEQALSVTSYLQLHALLELAAQDNTASSDDTDSSGEWGDADDEEETGGWNASTPANLSYVPPEWLNVSPGNVETSEWL